MVGPRFTRITASGSSSSIVAAATGYGKNLAIVRDLGNSGRSFAAEEHLGSTSPLNKMVCSSAGPMVALRASRQGRHTRPGGELHLLDVEQQSDSVFAAFGDLAARYHHFAASSDGQHVVAVGTYGVVCWRRAASRWEKTGAKQMKWKSFDKLVWPISTADERIPTPAVCSEGCPIFAIVMFR